MTVSELRRNLYAALTEARKTADYIDPRYETDEILRLCAGIAKTDAVLRPDAAVSKETECRCTEAVNRRKNGEPLGYILGFSPFFGYDFAVSEGCLIPRADTEVLVEEAVSLLPIGGTFWDLCTGSGCIPCAVLGERPDCPRAFAVDFYDIPLRLAESNAARLGFSDRLTVKKGDVLRGDKPESAEKPSLILSNPPYIEKSVCASLDAQVKKEPQTALCGGEDGLDFYRAILTHYRDCLTDGGCFLLEIGYRQGDALRSLAAEHGMSCSVRRDYAGHDRVAIIGK